MATKNRALALMVLAGVYMRQNKPQHAAIAVQKASAHADFPQLVKAARQLAAAPSRSTAANKSRLQRAAAWPFRQTATIGVGDDLREEPSEQNHLREVQEGAIEDDLELMGLGDEGGDEFADFDDFDPSLTDGIDDVDDADLIGAASEDDEDEEDESEEEKATASQRASVLARGLANLAAREMAAKKKKLTKKGKK